MKYHDSIEQAEHKLNMAVKQLQLWHLPVTPINYAVAYDFISQKNQQLISVIEQQLSTGKKLDNYFVEESYKQHILKQSSFRDGIIDELQEVIEGAHKNNERTSKGSEQLVSVLDHNIGNIQSGDQQKIEQAVKKIRQVTRSFKVQQQKINEHILQSNIKAKALQVELEELKKDVFLDPLTGLYNRKAMSKHLDMWLCEDPTRHVAAIVINVDQLSHINQKFGSLISDVLLSKIADKIKSYVGDSGLPVRSGGDEFLILLPDIEKGSAGEIAEKIRQGVEKLRFISSKSGVRLPQMTLSIGVNDYNVAENVNTIVKKTRQLLSSIQANAQNFVKVANHS